MVHGAPCFFAPPPSPPTSVFFRDVWLLLCTSPIMCLHPPTNTFPSLCLLVIILFTPLFCLRACVCACVCFPFFLLR